MIPSILVFMGKCVYAVLYVCLSVVIVISFFIFLLSLVLFTQHVSIMPSTFIVPGDLCQYCIVDK